MDEKIDNKNVHNKQQSQRKPTSPAKDPDNRKTSEAAKDSKSAQLRRASILADVKTAVKPVSASQLASKYGVSRQIIVGDVALLRASGEPVSATPRGYVFKAPDQGTIFGYSGILACRHFTEGLLEELYTVVDFGGTLIDVVIEHAIYGQISAPLQISSRYEADRFYEKVSQSSGRPLSELTDGIHIHHIGCKDEKTFLLIKKALTDKGILYD